MWRQGSVRTDCCLARPCDGMMGDRHAGSPCMRLCEEPLHDAALPFADLLARLGVSCGRLAAEPLGHGAAGRQCRAPGSASDPAVAAQRAELG